jgi:hypothetical protein
MTRQPLLARKGKLGEREMTDNALPKRRPDGTILPGNALNPTGRPRIVQEIRDMARGAAPAAFARVVAL